MRDRLTELLPLLMVGVIVVIVQFTRADGLRLPLTQPASSPVVPTPETAGAQIRPTPVPVPPRTPAMKPLDTCDARQPRFNGGLASLRAALGTRMGDALDCERTVDSAGNTEQQTTTGLAYYRKQTDAAVFTTGWDHWAIDGSRGVVYWAGDSVDPPVGAAQINAR